MSIEGWGLRDWGTNIFRVHDIDALIRLRVLQFSDCLFSSLGERERLERFERWLCEVKKNYLSFCGFLLGR